MRPASVTHKGGDTVLPSYMIQQATEVKGMAFRHTSLGFNPNSDTDKPYALYQVTATISASVFSSMKWGTITTYVTRLRIK